MHNNKTLCFCFDMCCKLWHKLEKNTFLLPGVYFRLSKKFEITQKRHVEKIVLYSVKNAAVVTKVDK